MANDDLPRWESFQLVHHSDALDPALALQVHAELIAHQAAFFELASHHEVSRPLERLAINQHDSLCVDALHDTTDQETSLSEMQTGVFDLCRQPGPVLQNPAANLDHLAQRNVTLDDSTLVYRQVNPTDIPGVEVEHRAEEDEAGCMFRVEQFDSFSNPGARQR